MKNTICFLVALLAAGVLGGEAQASVAVSSTSVAGVVLVAAPPSGSVTIIKSVRLCNDTASAMCVQIKDGSSIKTQLCAAAQACADLFNAKYTPAESPWGENFPVAGAFSVAGSTPAANAAGGATITATYNYQALR